MLLGGNDMMLVISGVFALFFGLFLNAVVDRIVDDVLDNNSRGRCNQCGHSLSWYDCIPVLSFVLNRGRCHYCQKHLSIRYPLLEIGALINLVSAYERYGDQMQTIYMFVFLCILLVLAALDHMFQKVPLIIIYMIALLAVLSALTTKEPILLDRICAAFLVSVPFALLTKFKNNSIGKGDIVFCACAGTFLGMWGIIFTVCIAYIFAGVYSFIMLLLHKLNRKSHIAMFPFFYLGAIVFVAYAVDFIHITLR